jgi:uncharacterized tellurite resistance protein B-like protein
MEFTSDIDAAKAFMLIAVTAVDGSLGPKEIAAIEPTLIRAGLSGEAAGAAIGRALQHYQRCIAADQLEEALVACADRLKIALDVRDRRAFLTHLVDAALVDDRYQPNEHAFLKMLGTAWEL